MRKVFSLILVLVLCMTMALPVLAANAPSAGGGSGSGAPTASKMMLLDANGNPLVDADHNCLKVVSMAKDSDLLGKLPAKAADMKTKYLYDVTVCDACEALLEPAGNVLVVEFELDVKKNDKVVVMTYKNDAWGDIEKVEVKTGKVVCTFEHLCPVVIATSASLLNPRTGDIIMMWVGIMAVSAVAVVALIALRRKAK
nr:hypothetical protein [Oscillospiraceae bacterium]